jgi:hypothetical protein
MEPCSLRTDTDSPMSSPWSPGSLLLNRHNGRAAVVFARVADSWSGSRVTSLWLLASLDMEPPYQGELLWFQSCFIEVDHP